MASDFTGVYQFKITLDEIEPPVWRRIQVPGSYTFWDLHVAIQDAMGWLDYHLHEFEIFNPVTGRGDRIGIPGDETDDWSWEPGWELAISDYFTSSNKHAVYRYDFGDDWVHHIHFEKDLSRDNHVNYPRCIDGQRACPPEDCGGPSGYERFLEAIRDPEDDEHDEYLVWVGGSFDAEAFDAAAVSFDDPKERRKIAFEEE